MGKLLSTILFVTITVSVFSQQNKIDSLKQILHNYSDQDTLKISALIQISNAINTINTDSALVYADKAIKLSENINWATGLATSYRQKGLVFYYKSDYLSALMFSQRALGYTKRADSKLLEASIYSNIGNIYADIEDFDKALESYEKLLKIARQVKSIQDQLIALVNIAVVHTEQGNLYEAVKMYHSSLKLAEDHNLDTFIPTICNNLSKSYINLSENDKATEYLNVGIEKAIELKNLYVLAILKRNLADIYLKENNLEKAESLLLESISLSKSNNTLEWEAQSLKTLYQVYEKQDQVKKAYDIYKKYIVLRDSIVDGDKKAEFLKRDLTFENDKNQALANTEIERQKLIKKGTIIGGSGFILVSLIGFVLYYRKQNADALKQEAEFNAKVSDTELKALRAQMNPHFIFNALNSINDFIVKNDAESASKYLTKFAKIMRQTLENSIQKEITLADDLKLLELYMQIEAMRLSNKFTFIFEVDNQIDAEKTLVPPLILQPFIENSIWHGISKKEGIGHINISIKKENDMLVCIVEDNGVGLQNKASNKNKISLGQSITKKRIEIINKRKNTKGTVELINKEEGLRVEVKLPFQLAY
ncbi:tetratricopeptide repeat-containing sensor histidine kinase [Confluentibacter lentus]|uniref:tetratricopeptide repeat-containing sensor histidine kinase n=1 Tax=Confluentibacter lentus TaxID=1699412 RepID=UPI000C284005|nr:histidine kinase [Confluentibacter lentus]